MAAALIDREVNQNGWPANDPFFLPGTVLDNMPNYQTGIIQALGRFAVEMVDQIGRTRGSSQADPDLDKAAGLLKYAPNVWIFDFSTSLAPTASSESQYRAAHQALLAYNEKLMSNKAVFERRTDNLLATLDRFAADIGSVSAIIDQRSAITPAISSTSTPMTSSTTPRARRTPMRCCFALSDGISPR